MSDRNARHGNDRRNDRQRRSRVDSKNHRETVRRTCKKVFQYELDDLKDQLVR
jgi:hypothetical protein